MAQQHAIFAELILKLTVLYGTIGGIFGFLAFLYATMWSLLTGAELSAVLKSRREGSGQGSSGGQIP